MNENLNEMTEATEKAVSTASTKLTGKDKAKITGIVTGIAAAGYAVGTYVIKPGIRWLIKKVSKKKVADAPKKDKKAKDEEPAEAEESEETEE